MSELVFIRAAEVVLRTGLSRSGIYAAIRNSKFPEPVSIGRRAVAWREADVMAWMADRAVAGWTKSRNTTAATRRRKELREADHATGDPAAARAARRAARAAEATKTIAAREVATAARAGQRSRADGRRAAAAQRVS